VNIMAAHDVNIMAASGVFSQKSDFLRSPKDESSHSLETLISTSLT
jgi:hypothetical protein